MGFFVADGNGAVAHLVDLEVEVLTDLGRVLLAMLGQEPRGPGDSAQPTAAPSAVEALATMVGIDDDAQRPDNPALARLLPDGYRDDDDAAGDFRRFTQGDLKAKKQADVQALLTDLVRGKQDPDAPESGAVVRLDSDGSRVWSRALNDMRLALGTSLGVSEDDPRVRGDDPRLPLLEIYDWLTGLQSTLIDTLHPRSS